MASNAATAAVATAAAAAASAAATAVAAAAAAAQTMADSSQTLAKAKLVETQVRNYTPVFTRTTPLCQRRQIFFCKNMPHTNAPYA